MENLKTTQLSWKNIGKFTVASGFSQIQACSGAVLLLPRGPAAQKPFMRTSRTLMAKTEVLEEATCFLTLASLLLCTPKRKSQLAGILTGVKGLRVWQRRGKASSG